MSENNIICKIHDEPNIKIKFNDPKIIIKLGNQGLKGETGPTGPTGPAGTTDHSELSNLDYVHAGHTGFQKELVYDPYSHCYIINN